MLSKRHALHIGGSKSTELKLRAIKYRNKFFGFEHLEFEHLRFEHLGIYWL
jgi:hypothetical protein